MAFLTKSSNPSVPEMTAEERKLLDTANSLLEKQGIRLEESDLQNQEIYNLVKDLSGLYTSVTTPDTRKTETTTVVDSARIQGEIAIAEAQKKGAPARDAFKYDQQISRLQGFLQNPDAAIQAGYGRNVTTETGVAGGTEMQLNPTAVAALKEKIAASQADQERISQLERETYERALRGEGPVSEGTTQRQARDFEILKENLARMGSKVVGETPGTAVSPSTTGAVNLGEFRKSVAVENDAERRGYLGFGSGVVDRYNPASVVSPVASSTAAFGPGANAAGYAGMSQGYLGLTQPYTNQRMLQYQGALQGAANKAGMLSSIGQIGGQIGAAYLFGPYGPLAKKAYEATYA